jgi:hypothetical protein
MMDKKLNIIFDEKDKCGTSRLVIFELGTSNRVVLMYF